jgi:sterol desaturase/sphingolipid hydroxylase (fatty acid hydroxylase superfamily)
LSTAEAHRWHHSRRREEADANYGQVLLIWDLLFGTRRMSQVLPPPTEVGFDGDAGYPRGYLGQLLAPFRQRSRQALH